jgi:hypothetical protein
MKAESIIGKKEINERTKRALHYSLISDEKEITKGNREGESAL